MSQLDVRIRDVERARHPGHAGIVEQQVDTAGLRPAEIGEFFEFGAMAHIDAGGNCLGAAGADLGGRPFGRLKIEIGDGDESRALFGKRQRDAPPDAGGSTGNGRPSSFNLHGQPFNESLSSAEKSDLSQIL